MFELPTQLSSIVLEIANVQGIILMKQDDDITDREISNNKSEDPGVSTLSFDIEEDDLDIRQEVLHLHVRGSHIIEVMVLDNLSQGFMSYKMIYKMLSLDNTSGQSDC